MKKQLRLVLFVPVSSDSRGRTRLVQIVPVDVKNGKFVKIGGKA